VRADREKAAQVLLNLFANAIKFTEPGGDVRLRVERAAGAADGSSLVRLHVTDTGRGIPSEKLEAVFEPFVQVGKRFAGDAPGTGLGLAISRDLARGMGGELTVESTPGAGSTFTLTLPAA
jgi:signal transduction histidine kinase